MLESSLGFNDYDYCLVHLLKKYPEYKHFYQKACKDKRIVFLDNSCYELGASVSADELMYGVREIHPTHVIAPDYLDDLDRTVRMSERFAMMLENSRYTGDIIAVVQGKTYDEYVQCYKYYVASGRYDWIAFPFDIKCLHEEAEKLAKTKTQVFAYSRNILLKKMVEDEIIDYSFPHHLLGCSDPVEFLEYHKHCYSFLHSVDTSCPVILAMFGEELKEGGLVGEKRREKLADNLNYEFTDESRKLMYNNIKVFREHYLGRKEECQIVTRN